MARRYDAQTTTFSPEGRLYQVEYAVAAIANAAAAVGLLASDGIVIASEKRVSSKLLAPPRSSDKMHRLDEHIFAAVAGLTSDANILLQYARVAAQRYRATYGEEQPVEALTQLVCDYKHSYTQYGGLRPFGVAFLVGGWDRHHGFQLYESDPSGNYSGWRASAIGSNAANSSSALKSDYKDGMSLIDAVKLSVKVLTKAMDTTAPSSEKIEVTTLSREGGKLVQRSLSAQEVDALIAETAAATAAAADA